jgi:hypothetical protein
LGIGGRDSGATSSVAEGLFGGWGDWFSGRSSRKASPADGTCWAAAGAGIKPAEHNAATAIREHAINAMGLMV